MRLVKHPPSLPPRPLDGQKGLFGRVLVVGGSRDMIGAPALAGAAALRMGSGLVQIAMPREVLASAISVVPELIGLALDETAKNLSHLLEAAEKADVLVIGPGLGRSPWASRRIDALIRLQKPAVVDADALNYLASLKSWPARFKLKAVLTPHPGEMKRLIKQAVPTDDAGRLFLAASAANRFGQIILLKGHRTVVTDGQKAYVNNSGDSSLSKAGSGDVLSGMLASLVGQGMDLFDAACAAAFLHGRAGEMAGKKLGRRCVLARDVIDAIPDAIR